MALLSGYADVFTGRNEVLAKVIFSQACEFCSQGAGSGLVRGVSEIFGWGVSEIFGGV